MRKSTVRVKDGKADITDLMFAQLNLPRTGAAEDFLHVTLGYTEERLKDLFGKQLKLSPKD